MNSVVTATLGAPVSLSVPLYIIPRWGMCIEGDAALSGALSTVTADCGATPGLVDVFTNMIGGDGAGFPNTACNTLDAAGIFPMLTTQPCDDLTQVLNGANDAIITKWANGAAAYGKPVMFRPWREMNLKAGGAYQWTYATTSAANYVACWQYLYEKIKPVAPNVLFQWCIAGGGTSDFDTAFPGGAYVDWVGFDSYVGNNQQDWSATNSIYNDLASLTKVPIMVAEFSSWTTSGFTDTQRAAWITATFAYIKQHQPRVKCAVWFNGTGPPGATYAFDNANYPLSQAAFQSAVSVF